MATLLLRCVAPLQSWDTQSRFGVRTTGREPSKSGIVGLLCAALGRPRTEPVDDLAALRMGVRVDQEGTILRDWHTAGKGGYLRAGGTVERVNVITSTRYYLMDAAFLVGLESDNQAFLNQLHLALSNPYWMLFLGRKACPPAMPLYLKDGMRKKSLLDALKCYPWLGRNASSQPEQLRLILDDPDGAQVFNDHPTSFAKGHRQFAPRRVTTSFFPIPKQNEASASSESSEVSP